MKLYDNILIILTVNESNTSTKSISRNVNPATFKTFWIAGTGPIPIISGGTPTVEYATRRANGFNPNSFTASSDAINTAAAPSQMPYFMEFIVINSNITIEICIISIQMHCQPLQRHLF